MPKSELIVGLDIGTTKICAVVGTPTDDGVMSVVGVGIHPSTGLRRGVVVNIEQTVDSIRKAIEDARMMAGCDPIRSVYVGIAGSHIKGLNSHGVIAVKGEEITQTDIDRVLEAASAIPIPQDREVIHTLPQEFCVDKQPGINNPLAMAGTRLEVKVHIVTAAVTSVQNITRCCSKSGLDTASIELESLASAKAVLNDEEREIGVALIDLGGGTCDVAIFENNAIKYTSVVGLGGQNLTNDIAFGLRTPMASAEQIKIHHGVAIPDLARSDEYIEVPSVGGREPRRLSQQVLAGICEPRMREILEFLDQELIRSGLKHKLGAGVVLTGGTSLIHGCQELAEDVFRLPTRIGYPRRITGLTDMVNKPKFATAIGLLYFGQEESSKNRLIPVSTTKELVTHDSIISRMKRWFVDRF
ncbi:MAG: cell division protein FtsA [Desulfovibrionaceae bacterium]|nr:cell division protein FtsA [Desulfovibrionaceae bacterium]